MMLVVFYNSLIFGIDFDDFSEVGVHGVGVIGKIDGVLAVGEHIVEGNILCNFFSLICYEHFILLMRKRQ